EHSRRVGGATPGLQDAVGEAERILREARRLERGAEGLALIGKPARELAVGGLKLRTRPERGGQREAIEHAVRHRALEDRLHAFDASRDFGFVTSGNHEPKRFALLAELL